MGDKVYMVTTGSYSDYGVQGIFSTLAKAEKYQAQCAKSEECYHRTDFNGIQEMTLDEGLQEKEYTRWSIGLMLDDGSIESFNRQITKPVSQRIWGIPESRYTIAEEIPAHNGRGAIRAESHKSAEHCMKLAVEGRQEWLRLRGERAS